MSLVALVLYSFTVLLVILLKLVMVYDNNDDDNSDRDNNDNNNNNCGLKNNNNNNANLTSTHIFVPFVIETSGAWNAQAIELTQEIGRRTTAVTGDPLETNHLFQRLSIAIQQQMQSLLRAHSNLSESHIQP